MTSAAGLPRTPPQRPPMRRGVREAIIAIAALPVLLATGVYLGLHVRTSSADGGTAAATSPTPVVTVKPAAPTPLVTVKPAAPRPVVTVKPAAPRPVVTVKPAAPRPVLTVRPPAPGPATPAPSDGTPATAGPAAPATPPPGPAGVLARGSTGPDVRAWQRQLARRGWRIRVDGIYGRQTARVVRRFQREKGLRVDGLIGPRTWAAAWQLPVTR